METHKLTVIRLTHKGQSHDGRDHFDIQWDRDTSASVLPHKIKEKFGLLDNLKTKVYLPDQEEPIFDARDWKTAQKPKHLKEVLGKASIVSVVVGDSEGEVSDTIRAPPPIQMTSDIEGGCPIIHVKLGNSKERNFVQGIVDHRPVKYQLTTSDLCGRKMVIYIVDPMYREPIQRENGDREHRTIKVTIPRETRFVNIRTDPASPGTFTVFCVLKNSDKLEIPFRDGVVQIFESRDNDHEQRWKKYGIPFMNAAATVAGAAI